MKIGVARLMMVAVGTLAFSTFAWADLTGTVYEGIPNSGNAADPANQGSGLASATFTSTGINYCSGYSDISCSSAAYNVSAFLNSPTFSNEVNGFSPTASLLNTEVVLTGSIFLTSGANNFEVAHDDGLTISVNTIGLVLNDGGPTGPALTPFTITAPSTGLYTFTLDYAECCGSPAVLQWVYPNGAPIGAVPEPTNVGLVLFGALGVAVLVRRKLAGARA